MINIMVKTINKTSMKVLLRVTSSDEELEKWREAQYTEFS